MREPFRKFIKAELQNGFLLISCGLPGTAKTGIADVVQKIKGGKMLCTDIIRLEVLKGQDIFDSKVAGDMKQRTRVYDAMFAQAEEAFKSERNVILDATFVTQELRQQAAAIAAKKEIDLARFIYSLGIRHVGEETAILLSQKLDLKNKKISKF